MVVNKPRNINDVELLDHGPNLDLPPSEPTDMSYFLQRLRLAEISRNIVDYTSMAMRTAAGRPSYPIQVMTLDFELHEMIRDIPPFLSLDSYGVAPNIAQIEVFIQAYLLNSLIQLQRCKLHLSYLTSGPANNPAYASSRETCLQAAYRIIRAERQLEGTQHVFVQTRLRLSVILHGVFMASIVLLMDACVNGTTRLDSSLSDELKDALRIADEAKCHSASACKLHDSLMQILARYREQQSQGFGTASSAAIPESNQNPSQGQAIHLENPHLVDARGFGEAGGQSKISTAAWETPSDVMNGQSYHAGQLAQSLDHSMDMDGFEWDDLLSTLGSSSFF